MPQSGDGDFWPTEDGDGAAAEGPKRQSPAPRWPAADPKDSQAGGYAEQNSGLRAGGEQRAEARAVPEVAEVSEASATASERVDQETSELAVPESRDDQPAGGWWGDEPGGDSPGGTRPAVSTRQPDQPVEYFAIPEAEHPAAGEADTSEEAEPSSGDRRQHAEWPSEERGVDLFAERPADRWLDQRPAWSADPKPEPDQRGQRPGGWPERSADPRQPQRPDARRPEQQRNPSVSWPVAELEQSPQPPPRRVPPPPSSAEATTVMRPVPSRGSAEETTFLAAASKPAPRSEPWPPPEPSRAAPRRVGPQPEDDDEPEPAPRRSRRKPILITLIALVAVVGLAAGAVFLVPGLSDRLGLTSADPVATGPPPEPVTFSPGLRGPDAAAPAPSPAGIAAALAGPASDSGLGNLTGVVVDPANGQTLWESGANTPLVPASTTKLLTAAAALLSLDPTEELVTKVVEGATPGEVVIVGGGDLTVSSLQPGQESVYPGAAYLSDLVEQVRASGVAVTSVTVDLTLYKGDSLAPGWLPEDINGNGVGYITRMAPVMLDGDRADDPTNVDGVRTGNPGRRIAEAFAGRIGATVPGTVEATAPPNARVLGEIRSAPLVELVYNMLTTSDNMLAEVVAHEVARGAGEEVSFAGGARATMELLRQNGFNVDGAALSDGSGMSTQNQVPARLLAEILSVAAAPDGDDPRTAKLRPILAGLPVAGGTGTLDDAHNRFGEPDTTSARGWARAKTGTLSGVNSLAGIVLDKDGRLLVFALMTSDSVSTTARPALDGIVAALRGCGCQ